MVIVASAYHRGQSIALLLITFVVLIYRRCHRTQSIQNIAPLCVNINHETHNENGYIIVLLKKTLFKLYEIQFFFPFLVFFHSPEKHSQLGHCIEPQWPFRFLLDTWFTRSSSHQVLGTRYWCDLYKHKEEKAQKRVLFRKTSRLVLGSKIKIIILLDEKYNQIWLRKYDWSFFNEPICFNSSSTSTQVSSRCMVRSHVRLEQDVKLQQLLKH